MIGKQISVAQLSRAQRSIVLSAVTFEYGLILAFLSWLLSVRTGLVLGLVAAGIHLLFCSNLRLTARLIRTLCWLLWSTTVDWLVLTGGAILHFQAIGAGLFKNADGFWHVLQVSTMLAAGVLVVRTAVTLGLRLVLDFPRGAKSGNRG
ncbi:MAG: hypothetical protein MUE94_07345 [Verrucomicrobia bacterium]|nr:hypothetical protein [Verrucomicrobiota bacterium]